MNIGWIYPHVDRCGITLYSERYLAEIGETIEIRRFSPLDYIGRKREFLAEINRCDLIHIQYESSFFAVDEKDFYGRLCSELTRPLIVSLHEVYSIFPGVYPREAIDGTGPLLGLKQWLYDRRHPLQTAYRHHTAQAFHADRILVHQEYHKDILREQAVDTGKISVVPHPILPVPDAPRFLLWNSQRPLRLAGSGFINPHYNYDLLIAALERLTIPWEFTWIGGVRRNEDEGLWKKLLHAAEERGWQERFRITGWLPDHELAEALCATDFFLALFSARSSSGSLSSAVGALRPIIATSLPLTRELSEKHHIIHVVESSPEAVAEGILLLINDETYRTELEKNVAEYRERYDYETMAKSMIALYKEMLP